MSGGGREAEIEVAEAVLNRVPPGTPRHQVAEHVVAALDAVRSSGSAAQDQEGRVFWQCPRHSHVLWVDEPEEGEAYCFQCDRDVADDAIEVRYVPVAVSDPDPVGGREAEREAVARAMCEQGMGFDIDEDPVARESMFTVAEVILAALDALRSSGSAAQDQEDDEWQYTEEKVTPEQARAAAHMARGCGSAAQNQEEGHRCWCGTLSYQATCKQVDCPRSPQGEDQEEERDLMNDERIEVAEYADDATIHGARWRYERDEAVVEADRLRGTLEWMAAEDRRLRDALEWIAAGSFRNAGEAMDRAAKALEASKP